VTTPPEENVEAPIPAWQSALRLSVLIVPTVALGFLYSWGAVIFMLALIGCIFLHELGHYLAAKRAGMKVTQFYLFFGPKVWSFRRGETEYGVRLIPLGAFVKVPGMHNLDLNVDQADESRTYRAASYPSRMKMAAAGSLMHFAIALVLIGAAYAAYGVTTQSKAWKVNQVYADSPAAAVGMLAGDRVTAYDGRPMTDYDKFVNYLHGHENVAVTLTVRRGTDTLTLTPTLSSLSSVDKCRTGGYLGFQPVDDNATTARLSPFGTVKQTFVEFGSTISNSLNRLGKIMSFSSLKSYSKSVTSGCSTDERFVSPVGAVKIGSLVAKSGTNNLLLFLAQANIFLGVVNWVPLLPFDGGHLALATYERLRSRAGKRYVADVSKMMPFVYAIMLFMLVLTFTNGYLDIFHLGF
jgi:membrane-associated protease RseP (regulator of RpoE activity)